VTINYRLGALGFLQLTDVTGADGPFDSNLGIRDQVAALEWVRDNVAAFGGDPGNVTIFGESAGAMSVGTLLGTPAARGLFHRAILQSGAAHNVSSREQAARTAETMLGELGLSRERAERLREVPVPVLLAAQTRTSLQLGLGHGTLPWQPAVDGGLVPEPPLDAIARGAANRVPVLIGTNADEWKLFLLGDRRARRMDEAALRRRLGRALPGHAPDGTPFAERALAVYRRAHPRWPAAAWSAFQGDRVFRWPAARLADLHSAHERETYAYLFDWSPWLVRARVGACHAIEIPLLFGTFRHPLVRPIYGANRGVRLLARSLQEAWCAFARDGDPNHGAFPEWPAWDARRRTLMRIGAKSAAEETPDPDALRFWGTLVDEVDQRALGSSRQPTSPFRSATSAPKTES
jgi:para-nitrobenzyl esterase